MVLTELTQKCSLSFPYSIKDSNSVPTDMESRKFLVIQLRLRKKEKKPKQTQSDLSRLQNIARNNPENRYNPRVHLPEF